MRRSRTRQAGRARRCAERDGQSPCLAPVPAVGGLQVQMRLGAVAGVASRANDGAFSHLVANSDGDRAFLKVGQEDVRPVLVSGDDDVVARDGGRTASDATRLAEHVRQQGQLRASGVMVRFAVVGDDHPTWTGGQDGRAEADEGHRRRCSGLASDQRTDTASTTSPGSPRVPALMPECPTNDHRSLRQHALPRHARLPAVCSRSSTAFEEWRCGLVRSDAVALEGPLPGLRGVY